MTPLDVALERGHEETANLLIHLEVEASNMPDVNVTPLPTIPHHHSNPPSIPMCSWDHGTLGFLKLREGTRKNDHGTNLNLLGSPVDPHVLPGLASTMPAP